MKNWIVVAHRGGARLVDVDDEDALRVFETVDFPVNEAAERPADSHHGERRNEARDSARGHAAMVFAGELAERLRVGRIANHYEELVLIAAPRFLGVLRDALDSATASCVRGTLDKDYAGLNDRDLLTRLEKM
jgi:protein required for attachment to host cells